jgi:type IV pilus assembly protein PilW
LIEVLVGIAVGLIGMLVIFQTLSVWDKYTRTAASSSDAQTAGTLAAFNLERDLKQAGLGFGNASASVMGCSVAQASGVAFALAPVVIASTPASGTVSGTDRLTVLHGNSDILATAETFTSSTLNSKTLRRRGGFRVGDFVVVAGNDNPASAASADCDLVRITAASAPDGLTVDHVGTVTVSSYSSGSVFTLGSAPQSNVWSVGTDNVLRVRNVLTGAENVVAENVVDLKAQYGIDLDGDRRISAPVSASAPSEWTTVPPADWTKVLAVRMAILVRGRQFEKDVDAPSASALAAPPRWFGNDFAMRNVNNMPDTFAPGDRDANNWRNYRYRVYERVVPLRNMVWGTQFD